VCAVLTGWQCDRNGALQPSSPLRKPNQFLLWIVVFLPSSTDQSHRHYPLGLLFCLPVVASLFCPEVLKI